MPLGTRQDLGDAAYAGCETAVVGACDDPAEALHRARADGFDFVVVPCAKDERAELNGDAYPTTPFAHSDVVLSSEEWSTRVVLRASTTIEGEARAVEETASAAEEGREDEREASRAKWTRALARELRWAAHVGAHAYALSLTAIGCGAGYDAVLLSQVLSEHLPALTHTKTWLRVRAEDESDYATWTSVCAALGHHSNVYALIDVTASAKNALGSALEGDRWRKWLGERVGACALRVDAFSRNARGFPVLPKNLQRVVRELFKHNIQIVISDRDEQGERIDAIRPGDIEGDEDRMDVDAAHPLRLYWEYVVHLFRGVEEATEQELLEMPYRDYLQAPLQPLMDNLESVTYETFEKDASKYIQYEEAVRCALLDLVNPDEEGSVMVVGAGRGPLVRASLRAAERAQRRIKVYAVEKNPNAVVTLQHLVVREGLQDKVQIFPGDMRTCALDLKVDVLVSELLGSFGDNELSPECLDGAQRFLKPTGVSVPRSYESFVAPVTAAKLYNAAKAQNDLKSLETPYVVKMHRFYSVGKPRRVWEFVHPNNAKVINNERCTRILWRKGEAVGPATIHGFAGYFDALLYDGPSGHVRCSIHPDNHTLGPSGELMFSWFPIYFPIREPVVVNEDDVVDFTIWRKVDGYKMWYEWVMSSPRQCSIHNPNGRSYWIGL